MGPIFRQSPRRHEAHDAHAKYAKTREIHSFHNLAFPVNRPFVRMEVTVKTRLGDGELEIILFEEG